MCDTEHIPLPLVTIVTVVFNGEGFLEQTILSVVNQSYKNIEYIVIDGGSTDGTLDIINKYSHKITYWISEPDKGIYDAMNKGIVFSTGKWLNFLNAGDSFVDNFVLEKIFTSNFKDVTIIYGNIRVLKEGSQSYEHKAITLIDDKSIMKGMLICHQAIFYSKAIMELYDDSLRLKSEWKHLIKITKNKNFKPLKLEIPFVYYRIGGMGAQQIGLNQFEYRKVFLEEYGLLSYIRYIPFFTWMTLKRYFKELFFL